MAITVSGNPYSTQGASVSGLVSAEYMTGKVKTNNGMLMNNKPLPDFSGMKIEPMAGSKPLSLVVPKDTVIIENTEAAAATNNKPAADTEPLKMYTANTAGLTFIEPKYTLHGAEFTHDQIRTSTEFLEGLSQLMRENGVLGGALDYDDYAVMGFGESQIRMFGKGQGFNEEQINGVITDYRNTLTELVKENLSKYPFDRQATHLPHSEYFFMYRSEEMDLGELHIKEGTLITTPDLAVNWNMIRSVYSTMARAEADDIASVKKAVEQFREQALVARKAGPSVGRPDWAAWRVSVYEDNINKFQEAAALLQKAKQAKYPHLDIKA